ncbi:MAG: DUF5305 family protein [Chloroflexota bacterium]|nr:DUF5305 family protein [Chloroflexota bacterium]
MKRLVWKSFVRSGWVRAICFLLVAIFLGASAFGIYRSFQSPMEVKRRIPLVNYEHVGKFNYTVHIKPSTLFDTTQLGPGQLYFTKLTEDIQLSFSYKFKADRPIEDLTEEYEVTATLESPKMWKKEFVLVPKTKAKEDFVARFSLPISQYNGLIETIERETGVSGGPYDLTINAEVHSVAQTDYGAIDEAFEQPLTMHLEGGLIRVDEQLEKTEPGSIEETRVVAVLEPRRYKILAGAGVAVSLLLFVYLLWMYSVPSAKRLTAEDEFRKARRSYGEFIVEAEALPSLSQDQVVVRLTSLEDLVKVAEEMFRPIIHGTQEDKHIYCTIESSGTVRYEYVSERRNEAQT